MSGIKLPQKQVNLRLDCLSKKMLDRDAAAICGVSEWTFASWRRKRGFLNGGHYLPELDESVVMQKTRDNRSCLTGDSLKYYKHNDNSGRFAKSEGIILRVDVSPDVADKVTEPISRLSDGPKSGTNELVVGKKWDRSPELFTFGKKSFDNRMYGTCRNVNGSASTKLKIIDKCT